MADSFDVLKPLEGESYWQPSPNDGTRVTLKLEDKQHANAPFHLGMHHMAPGSCIPKHFHQSSFEVIFIHKGWVKGVVDGKGITMQAGDSLILPPMVEHQLENSSGEEVILLWAISADSGLVPYFRSIGKLVQSTDEAAPPPFFGNRTDSASIQKS